MSSSPCSIAPASSPGRARNSDARMPDARRSKPIASSSSSCARLRARALPKICAKSLIRSRSSSGQVRSRRTLPKLRPPYSSPSTIIGIVTWDFNPMRSQFARSKLASGGRSSRLANTTGRFARTRDHAHGQSSCAGPSAVARSTPGTA